MSGTRKSARPRGPARAGGERRRVGVVVHDDRGNARLEWVAAPSHNERTSLSLLEPETHSSGEHGYDPYANGARAPRDTGRKRRAGRDLRKLSEWIKQVRRVESLKRAENDEEDPQA